LVVAVGVWGQGAQELTHDFRLTIAARNGDFRGMEVALLNGANIDAIGNVASGQTALLAAAMSAREDVVKYLLEKGANPDITDNTGMNLWHYTCALGLNGIAKILANMGSDPHRVHPKDDQPTLHRCAAVRRRGLVKPVLETILSIKGVNVDYPTRKKGITALMSASKYGNYEMVEILIKHGAKVNKPDVDGRTALIYAIFGLTNPEESDTKDGFTFGPEAHRNNHIRTIKILLEQGADPLFESDRGESPAKLVTAHCMHDEEVKQLFKPHEDRRKAEIEAEFRKKQLKEEILEKEKVEKRAKEKRKAEQKAENPFNKGGETQKKQPEKTQKEPASSGSNQLPPEVTKTGPLTYKVKVDL